MKIKKSHLKIAGFFLTIIILAIIGYNLWNTQIITNAATINQFSIYLILGFAFAAGIISFFSPCGLALLPAFISYNMASIETNPNSNKKSESSLIKIGIFSALGIITFYILLGVFFSLLGSAISPYIQIFQYIIAFLFVAFGLMLIKKVSITNRLFQGIRVKAHEKASQQTGYKGFYIFGFAYGLDIIGCLFPLIAALVLIPISTGNLITGISAFLSYSVALAVMLTIFAYLIAYSKRSIVTDVLKSTEKLKTWTGIGLMLGGVLLLSYYIFFGMLVG